ncbi:hypothetical protein AWM75_03885 [Aerococcus urinaehominis]|uniref:UPF0316 protein AWM75_03885 n=1 Tax=Aerococcus urinaehominis TaxID=128944 RepID=A0A0X8FKV8_9LACT|nr:DUF2179 domain-containing protein [Aerococcus urinaehominis]AMB99196.1 hypothetical protein AWM75_03885 [Aerococcus urinaehominis]SDM32703.1 Uncharacterized protein YebE, UPF0316 family [Aerococcus urinaehominis]
MNWAILLQIFFINLIYIMLNTVRTLLAMKGYRKVAPFIAIVEVSIYTVGLSMVMQYLDQPIYLITYALGFGLGIYLGIMLEDRIALGYSVVQIFVPSTNHAMAEALRERGYGVTIQSGYGRDGDRLVLTILTPRSTERQLYKTINELDEKAFYIAYDAKNIHGGFWTKKVNKDLIKEAYQEDSLDANLEIGQAMSRKEYVAASGDEKPSQADADRNQ